MSIASIGATKPPVAAQPNQPTVKPEPPHHRHRGGAVASAAAQQPSQATAAAPQKLNKLA